MHKFPKTVSSGFLKDAAIRFLIQLLILKSHIHVDELKRKSCTLLLLAKKPQVEASIHTADITTHNDATLSKK